MNDRVELARARRAVEAEQQAVSGILILLEVGGREALLIRLGADGGIHRLGSGSIETMERDRFIGITDPETFHQLLSKATPALMEWCGQSRSHPSPRGDLCELVISFKRADGEESKMAWRYGSHSKWPPPEVLEFVAAAVEATRPWYENEKRRMRLQAERAEYDWWEFFTQPHA